MRRPLVAGNWKMHGSRAMASALVAEVAAALPAKADVAVLPPFPYIAALIGAHAGSRLAFGAQDASEHAQGAFTGEVSAAMLKDIGCAFVLAGHSERRQYHGESNAVVNAKVKAALKWGLVPIVCVGETLEIRQAGHQVSHCESQVEGGLDGLTSEQVAGLVIAYEPIWAIGTGEVAEPQDAQEAAAAIRDRVSAVHGRDAAANVRILYGGSVKADNIAVMMAQPAIDGALVGGASLDAGEFVRICRYRELAVGA